MNAERFMQMVTDLMMYGKAEVTLTPEDVKNAGLDRDLDGSWRLTLNVTLPRKEKGK